jgi:hypothetical protein
LKLSGLHGVISQNLILFKFLVIILSRALFVTSLLTSDTGDPLFSEFVCGEYFLAIWTVRVIIAALVALDKDGPSEVIIRV